MEAPRQTRSWATFFTLACLSCTALGIRLWGLGREALWVDELSRVVWSKGFECDNVFDVVAANTGVRLPPLPIVRALAVVTKHNPPLYGAILNSWMHLLRDPDDFAMRLPSALFSAACAPVMYFALRPRFGERAAAMGSVLVAASPYQVYFAQEVNHYAVCAFFVAVSFYFYLHYEERPTPGAGIGWALSATAANYTHYYAGVVLLFQWLALALGARGRRTSLSNVLWPCLLAAALFAPFVRTLRAQLPELTSTAQIGVFHVGDYFVARLLGMATMPYVGELGNNTTWPWALPVIVLSAALCTIGIARVAPADRRILLVNLLGPPVFVVAAFFIRKANSILWPRYQLFFSFALFACVGIALASLRRGAGLAMTLVVGLLAAAGNVAQHRIVREDWHGVAEAIDHSEVGNEPVLVYRQNLVYSVARYLHGRNRLYGIGASPDLERTLRNVVGSQSRKKGIWYASAWPEPNDMDRRVDVFLARHYARCDRADVNPGVVSLRLTHCWKRRKAKDEADRWMLPRPGPLLEGCSVESVRENGVIGWAFSSAGLRQIRVDVDGRTVADVPHPGMRRDDVVRAFVDYPRELTEPSGFFVPLKLEPDAIRRVHLAAVRWDGSLLEMPWKPSN